MHPAPVAYLTLPASALDRILSEATLMGIDPHWLLAALAAEMMAPRGEPVVSPALAFVAETLGRLIDAAANASLALVIARWMSPEE